MATFTGSELTSSVKFNATGVQVKASISTFTGTATAASAFLLAKVPNGATIVDFIFYADDAAADQTYKIGLVYPEGSASSSWTISKSALEGALSISGGVVRNMSSKLPYKVSLSGETQNKYAWVAATNGSATSASATMRLTVFYTLDE